MNSLLRWAVGSFLLLPIISHMRLLAAEAPPAPQRGFSEVSYANVRLQGGFWGPRLKTHNEVTIPHALNALENDGHVTNFDKAAGKFDGPLKGHHAFDSDLHKALEGALYSLRNFENAPLRQRVNGIIDRVLAAQEKDGFLISCFIVANREKRWDELRLEHQMYNAGHFFEMAVEHQAFTLEPKALDAARKFADHIDSIFGPKKRYDVDGHQEVELALVKLYRATNEKRYFDLAKFFLDERGYAHGAERKPFDPKTAVMPTRPEGPLTPEQRRDFNRAKYRVRNGRMQDHKPVVEQHEAIGHAVRAGYMYTAMADVVRFGEAPGYENALDDIWSDVVGRKLYITGGVGTGQYDDEGFGDPYRLPNNSAYCESCAAIANVLWQHRMNLLKGDAKYADIMELSLYNGVLSGIALSGDKFFYQNPLASKGGQRSSWIGLSCCPTNLARIIPQVGGLAISQRDRQVCVNLYLAGSATLELEKGQQLKLKLETDYPWQGQVRCTVSPAQNAAFNLSLRIPSWAQGKPVPSDLYRFQEPTTPAVVLKLNGEPVNFKIEPNGYVQLDRTWKEGDVVELNLPMPIRRVLAHENVQENKGKVALMRGPLVYCIEGVDLPGVDLTRLALPAAAELVATHRPELLGGVTVLQGEALGEGTRPLPLTAVPYYAWANRERGGMHVWIQQPAQNLPPK